MPNEEEIKRLETALLTLNGASDPKKSINCFEDQQKDELTSIEKHLDAVVNQKHTYDFYEKMVEEALNSKDVI